MTLRRLFVETRKSSVLALATICTALATASCALDAEGVDAGDGVEALGEVQEAVTIDPNQYTWASGRPATVLGPNGGHLGTTHTCFLSGVTGNFDARTTFVSTSIVNGRWRLSGSGPTDVSASAVCVQRPPRLESNWITGNLPVQLNTGNNSTCGFTMLQGDFLDTGEWVRINANRNFFPARWTLDGSNSALFRGARARCVDVNESIPLTFDERFLDNASDSVCILGHMQGKFRSGADKMLITRALHLGGVPWWKFDKQVGANGAARCMR